jgi:sec-independent protein translocase protein TatA
MGEFSPIHWLIVLAIIVLLFGGKKIPEVMRGLGEGIRSFKEGMHGNNATAPPASPAAPAAAPTTTPAEEKK